MKWGIRRFQNKDGSLTTAGKSRYGRGKDYSKERSKIKDAEYWRLRRTSEEYKNLEKEAYRIADKYDLDQDDGGGGDYTRFTEKELRSAGNRYWNLQESISALDEKISDQAEIYTKEKLIKKYGDTALSDINFYENTQNGIILASLAAALGGYIWLVTR